MPKNIISVKPSCGCLSAKISDNKKVLATFHGIVNYKGPVRKSILVTFEDGTTETLYISGELL